MLVFRKLVWDAWNVAHIARHEVTPDEVEEVCVSNSLVQRERKGRISLVGLTKRGRILTVILDPENEQGVYYPVTAYQSSRKYRRIFLIEKGGNNK